MLQRAFLLLVSVLILASCGENSGGRYPAGNNRLSEEAAPSPAQKVALLLPLTGPRADLGQVLQQAAQLARDNSAAFDIMDTGGTAAGAATAAQTAVTNGDRMILGPLTSAETASVAPIARSAGILVLAFTNDAAQSQPGVWAIGITADQQIRRLIAAAQGQGKTQFAALLPDTSFGRAMANALTTEVSAAGLPPPRVRMHAAGMAAITEAAKDLSDYANRRGPIDAKVRAARALGTADGRREAQELVKTPISPPEFDVLLLADTGDELQEVAAVLPYYDVDRGSVRIIGPALWSSAASGSAAVAGAWYAAPDNAARQNLERDYAAKYGTPPPALADLAFDAASIARVITGPRGPDVTLLTQTEGFIGTDGWLAFQPDGQVRRGLAVFRVERTGPTIVEPAPQSAGTPGS